MSVLSFLASRRRVSPAVLRGGMLPVGWQGVTRRALSGLELEWLAGLPVLEDGQGGWCAVTREGEAERLWDAQMWRGLVRMYLERGGALVGWDDAGRPWAVVRGARYVVRALEAADDSIFPTSNKGGGHVARGCIED